MKQVKTNLVVSIIYQFIAIVYGFVLPRLILERFGSEVNGLTQSISQFLGIISFLDMGVGQVVRSALYRPLENKDSDEISRILVAGGKFYQKIAKALLGYVLILVIVYPMLVEQRFDWLFIAGMIIVLAIGSFSQYYFGIIREQLLHASQKSYLIYGMQIACYLLNLVICVWMIRMDCSIHTVKLATAVIFLIKPLFYAWFIHRNFNINWKITYDSEPIKQKWNGIAQHISAVVLDGTDNIILTIFSTLSNVSVYSVYYMVIGSIQSFYQSAAVGIQSAAGAIWAKQDEEKIRRMFCNVEFGMHTVTVYLFSCTGVLIVPFVQVYTKGLADANYIQPLFAVLLVLAYGIRCLRTPYNIWILAAGHFKQTQKCHIIAAAINLIVSMLAVFQWGLVGVAIGTLIAMCFQTTWMAIYTTKNLIQYSFGNIVKQILTDLCAVGLTIIFCANVTLLEISYLGWFFMAMKVAGISAVSVGAVTCLFYPRRIIRGIRRLAGKEKKEK